jgi:hypothetical protein
MKFRETQAKKIRQLHTSRRISANLLKTKKKKKKKTRRKKEIFIMERQKQEILQTSHLELYKLQDNGFL